MMERSKFEEGCGAYWKVTMKVIKRRRSLERRNAIAMPNEGRYMQLSTIISLEKKKSRALEIETEWGFRANPGFSFHFSLILTLQISLPSDNTPDFMSAGLLAATGAPSKLCFPSALFFLCSVLCWCSQQGVLLCFPTVSMPLRPKRVCSGGECFGGFHINRLFNIFLFFRGPLT
ncbi:hypothetical protein L1987_61747 [Smallanthus sonchifolius]|uniref:Uncharacterized protein n=1 Tax=Smallanthus sonchifolius TaxID=185202 RepID=A0ACB9C8F8_9ASTR|nr:hypothetical protein L1987_61747 [Smallanthus sonchifolius]